MTRPATVLAIALAALYASAAFQPGHARDDLGIRDIMVEEPGRGAKKRTRVPREQAEPKARTRQRSQARGSSYVPPMTLPRSEAVRVPPPTPGVYTPPPINSFGDRVIGCNHSFPLNAGIGNNPTDRSSYVRQCAN